MKMLVYELCEGMIIEYQDKNYKISRKEFLKDKEGNDFIGLVMNDTSTGEQRAVAFPARAVFKVLNVELRKCLYLYLEDGKAHFMDAEVYTEYIRPATVFGGKTGYIPEGIDIMCYFLDNEIIRVMLPKVVEIEVVNTFPERKNESDYILVELKTGGFIYAPNHVCVGDIVYVNPEKPLCFGRIQDEYN